MIYSSKAGEGVEKDSFRALLETNPFKVKLNKVLPGTRWCRVFFCDTITISIKLILWRSFEKCFGT